MKIGDKAFQAEGGVRARTLRQEQTWQVSGSDRLECGDRRERQDKVKKGARSYPGLLSHREEWL